MKEFILGYPKNKKQEFTNIACFSNMQDAASACTDFVAITSDTLDNAKGKFIELATRDFKPQS